MENGLVNFYEGLLYIYFVVMCIYWEGDFCIVWLCYFQENKFFQVVFIMLLGIIIIGFLFQGWCKWKMEKFLVGYCQAIVDLWEMVQENFQEVLREIESLK